jgi:2-dehydro-3-deoxygalactonokinase
VSRPIIAVDWGTSSFRAYLLDGGGAIAERHETAGGILRVRGGDFAAALEAEIGPWLSRTICDSPPGPSLCDRRGS